MKRYTLCRYCGDEELSAAYRLVLLVFSVSRRVSFKRAGSIDVYFFYLSWLWVWLGHNFINDFLNLEYTLQEKALPRVIPSHTWYNGGCSMSLPRPLMLITECNKMNTISLAYGWRPMRSRRFNIAMFPHTLSWLYGNLFRLMITLATTQCQLFRQVSSAFINKDPYLKKCINIVKKYMIHFPEFILLPVPNFVFSVIPSQLVYAVPNLNMIRNGEGEVGG